MTPDIEATYRIVTPAFVGGANNKTTAELRLPSIKGALRFWWRTLAWSRIGNDLKKLWEEEARLFGSSDADIGQSKVILRLMDSNINVIQAGTRIAQANSGLAYFGYGLMPSFGPNAGMIERPALEIGGKFTLCIRLSNAITVDQRKQIKDAVLLLGHVGGLGSRSRRGWGSLTLEHLKLGGKEVVPTDAIKCLPENFMSHTLPEWTAWSPKSRLVDLKSTRLTTGALQSLDLVAREFVRFRCWGFSRIAATSVLGNVDSEFNFGDDHDLIKRTEQYAQPPHWHRAPDRAVFGLPHNYYTQVNGLDHRKTTVGIEPREFDRRASPLLFHVHQSNPEDAPIVRVVFLPATFLPGNSPEVTYQKNSPFTQDAELVIENLWWPIDAFLDRVLRVPPGKTYAEFLPNGARNELKEPLAATKVL